MNKKVLVASFVMVTIATLIAFNSVYAATVTPIPSVGESDEPSVQPTKQSSLDKAVENLKEKIADKVDTLKKNAGTIAAGSITDIKKDTIEIKNTTGHTFKIVIDASLTEAREISGTFEKTIKIADLTKNDYVFVSGPIVENTVTANTIYRDVPFFVGSGQITSVDTSAGTIDLVTTEKEEFTLDIPTKVRPKIMDPKTLEITRTTLAKIKAGDTVHFVSKKSTEDKKMLSAVTLFVIPQEYFSGK